MTLWTFTDGAKTALILETGGQPPEPRTLGLFLCRSLTLPPDRLLLGPLSMEPLPEFRAVDREGRPFPAQEPDAAAFQAMLEAAGYGTAPAVTDGTAQFRRDAAAIRLWHGRQLPRGLQLQRLLGL